MKKRLTVLLLACMMIVTTGCDIPFIGGGAKDAQEQNDKEDDKDDTGKEDWTSLDGEDDKEEDGLPAPIKFTYQDHIVKLQDGDDEMASGLFVTVELAGKAKSEYPKLAKALDTYDKNIEEDVTTFLADSEQEIREMRSEGMMMGYDYEKYIHPERSDEKAFSFVIESYMFLGGAHGSTSYYAYNLDPNTGREIKFNDVVADTDELPEKIFDELIKQNDDLTEYFEECPGDKDSLLESIGIKLDANAKDLVWSLCYDGIRIWFEDYAMGSYAAGTRSALVKFEDYPDVFTDEYDDYTDVKKVPGADDNARKDDDADPMIMQAKGASSETSEQKTHEAGEAKEEISLSKDQRQKLNIFISNFAEQGFYGYDETTSDAYKIAEFAYRWTRINKPNDVEIDGSYYKLGYDKIKKLAKKYLGRDISDKELDSYAWKNVKEEERFCKNGYYYAPAADGETHTGFALTSFAYDNGDGTLDVDFMGYYMDLDAFWDNDEIIPKSFYALTCDEANKNKDIEEGDYCGTAKVKKNGDSYTLVSFYTY